MASAATWRDLSRVRADSPSRSALCGVCVLLAALVLFIASPAVAAWVDADDVAMDDLGMISAIVAGCSGPTTDRAIMDAEVKRYLNIHAKTAAERAHADARAKAATAKATQTLKANAQPEAVCILKDAAVADFIGKLRKANKTGTTYQSAP